MSNGMDRRRFLRVLGATGGGAAALSGCAGDAAEKLIPYLVPPENQIPGRATWFASTCRECPAGCGLHVRTREGRAVKVEGNPASSINRGKLCARGQASLQGLYNPDRIRAPMARAASGEFQEISWDDAIARVSSALTGEEGRRIWFLTGNEAGSFDSLINDWLRALGSTGHVTYEPFGYEALRHANNQVFGIDALPSYDFAQAAFVISFGADFLESWLNPVENARGFAQAHGFSGGGMGRYVHVEPRMSMTAYSADEWIAPQAGTEGAIALAMAQVVLSEGLGNPPRGASRLAASLAPFTPESASELSGIRADKILALAREFAAGPSVALAGGIGAQHDEAHSTAAAVNLLNYVAGNVGTTVNFNAEINAAGGSSYQGLADLVGAVRDGDVGILLVHGANPVYAAPRSGFESVLGNVNLKVSFSRFLDETTSLCDVILPDHDPLEQWNDYEPRTGVYALQQPVMQPVFDTRQTGDVLLEVVRSVVGAQTRRLRAASYKEYLQGRWERLRRRLRDPRPFDVFWSESLQAGGVWTDAPSRRVRLAASARQIAGSAWVAPSSGYTLIAYPSAALYDGRGANRPWLQELPDPVSKFTWSSWVEMSPHAAQELGVSEGDMLRVETVNGSVEAPAFIYPGLRDDVIAMPLGQGHTAFGRYAKDVGVNVATLLNGQPTAFGGLSHYIAASVTNTGSHERVAKTSGRNRQMGRGIAQATTVAALLGEGVQEEHHEDHAAPVPDHIEDVLDRWQQEQWEDTKHGNYAGEHPRWAMVIDLSRCTGCSACVTACHAENNIPTVGKEQVGRGREMAWIRIERYYEDTQPGKPLEVRLLPMLCQHCGNAPCEPVCPVYATYHTPDGLNAQVYNRCVGTRYCSNNCPYKVRYFNFYDYPNEGDAAFSWPEPLHWQLNPDVTVREKGVMEKCTFCVQRIRGAQHQATLEGREVGDGEIVTACQQTCPADAIVFGNLKDPNSRVSQLAGSGRGYHVLESLNTYPGITYLKKVRNLRET